MMAEPGACTPRLDRADEPACWQFNIAAARQLLGDRCPAGDAEWGRDGRERFLAEVKVVEVNDAALRLFDLPADRTRVVARSIGNLWPEAGHPILAELLAIVVRDGSRTVTRELAHMDRWTDAVVTAWCSTEPGLADIVFVSIQATLDPAGALAELEASQYRYRSLISAIPLPLWDVDARAVGRIFDRMRLDEVTDLDAYLAEHPELVDLARELVVVAEANLDAAQLMEASDPADLLGPVGYIFNEAQDAARRVMLAHFAGQRNHVEQARIRTFQGHLRDVLLLVTYPVPGERLDSTLIMMIDITERLEMEARLRQVETDFTHAARLSTLGQMTASIAHEIKQPLSAIMTNAGASLRWLAKAEPNLTKLTQLSTRIAASAQRASDIIGRIQDMAGNRRPHQVRLDLNDVIREALTFVRHDSEEKAIRTQLDLALDLPPLIGDRIQLQQVVVNLLVNSGQALAALAPERRKITVSTFRHGPDAVGFAVRDTGPGIPEGDLERVFGGFFSTKQGGMGIGLTICRSIIAAHGGTITASAPAEGGVEFQVIVPLEPSSDH